MGEAIRVGVYVVCGLFVGAWSMHRSRARTSGVMWTIGGDSEWARDKAIAAFVFWPLAVALFVLGDVIAWLAGE